MINQRGNRKPKTQNKKKTKKREKNCSSLRQPTRLNTSHDQVAETSEKMPKEKEKKKKRHTHKSDHDEVYPPDHPKLPYP